MKTILAAVAISALGTVSASAAILDQYFTSYFALGDSLSDTGNLLVPDGSGGVVPLLPAPYYQAPDSLGRQFSDGPVYADQLDDAFDKGLTGGTITTRNYAFGGATALGGTAVPDLVEQTNLLAADLFGLDLGPLEPLFAGTPVAGDNALTSLWFGANDIFGALAGVGAGFLSESDAFLVAEMAAQAVAGAVTALSSLPGFDTFVVFNLPDIGGTPAFAGSTLATDLTTRFNTTLAEALALIRGEGTKVVEIDVYSIFEDIVAGIMSGDAPFGLTDYTSFCVVTDESLPRNLVYDCGDATGLVFWDPVHPTGVAHAELARVVEAAVVPLPPAMPMLAAGLLLVGLVRRRAAS